MKQTHSVVGPAMATSSELLCVIMQSQDALQYLRWPEETDKNKSNLGRVSSSLTTDSINYNCTVTNPKSWRVQCSVCGAFSLFRWTKLKVWVLQTECVLQCVLVFRLVYYLWRELCSEKTRLQQSKQTHTSRRWWNIRGWHERRLGRSDQEGQFTPGIWMHLEWWLVHSAWKHQHTSLGQKEHNVSNTKKEISSYIHSICICIIGHFRKFTADIAPQ